jgi:hypothetical protein
MKVRFSAKYVSYPYRLAGLGMEKIAIFTNYTLFDSVPGVPSMTKVECPWLKKTWEGISANKECWEEICKAVEKITGVPVNGDTAAESQAYGGETQAAIGLPEII